MYQLKTISWILTVIIAFQLFEPDKSGFLYISEWNTLMILKWSAFAILCLLITTFAIWKYGKTRLNMLFSPTMPSKGMYTTMLKRNYSDTDTMLCSSSRGI